MIKMMFDLITTYQFNSFVEYCKKNSIDMNILNKLDTYLKESLANESKPLKTSDGDIYLKVTTEKQSFLFKFYDETAYNELFGKSTSTDKTNSYMYTTESEIEVAKHLLKYIIIRTNEESIVYTFDSNDRNIVMRVDTDGDVLITDTLAAEIGFNLIRENGDNCHWSYVSSDTLPDELQRVVTVQKVLLDMRE